MEGIIIVGHGRMGREIESQAVNMGIPICAIADNYKELTELANAGAFTAGRIALEFTGGAIAIENLEYLLNQNCPIVCGSTPWGESSHRNILELRHKLKGYLMFSSNYSIGIQIFWRVVREASRLMNYFAQYDLGIYEQHHNQKADSPSGTAVKTAEIVLQEVTRKKHMLYGPPQLPDGSDRPIALDELQLSSQRLGHIAGVHQLLCDSPEDSIIVSHQAHNRIGLARGALLAAQFLHQQVAEDNPGFFEMSHLMEYFLQIK